MADASLIKILDQGVQVWNGWLASSSIDRPDLTGAPLAGRNLQGIDLSSAELREAMLTFESGEQEYASLIRTGLDRVLVWAVMSKGHVDLETVQQFLDVLSQRIKDGSLQVNEVKDGILAFDNEARRITFAAGKEGVFRYTSQRNAARSLLLRFANSLHR